MYNKVILMGRICNDLELKETTNGNKVVSFRLAVDRGYQTKGEEKKTDFLNVTAWRSVAEFISKYFSKGRLILLEGELQTRSFDNKDGETQWITEVVVSKAEFTGEAKPVSPNQAPITNQPAYVPPPTSLVEFANGTNSTDEEYPF